LTDAVTQVITALSALVPAAAVLWRFIASREVIKVETLKTAQAIKTEELKRTSVSQEAVSNVRGNATPGSSISP
jgi:hypothetical protein